MRKIKYTLLLIIFLLAFLSSIFLSQGYSCNSEGICSFNDSDSLLMNKVVNGYIGAVIFFVLSIITYFQIHNYHRRRKQAIHIGVLAGSLIGIGLLITQIVSSSYCRYCLIIDIGLVLGLILTLAWWKH